MKREETTDLVHEDTVRQEWIDYNGHMSEAFYVLVFGHATDDFLDAVGLDSAYRDKQEVSAFTVEAHIRYLDQAGSGDPLHVTTLLTDCDAKRARIFHTMRLGQEGPVLATEEVLLLHVNTARDKVSPFDDTIREKLSEIASQHGETPRPKDLGRAISMPG